MKKGLIFFSLLALFSQCDPDVHVRPALTEGYGKNFGGNEGRGSGGTQEQPSLTRPPSKQAHRPKKKRVRQRQVSPVAQQVPVTRRDSIFTAHLDYLRSNRIEADPGEPVNIERLSKPSANGAFPSMITLSRESFLRISFDNDILDYTDRFYTNGIRIEIIAPGLRSNPLTRLLVPFRGNGTNHYGLAIVQNMYTPSTTKIGGILYGDRPYAAYLYVGSFKISSDPVSHYRQTSSIDLGIIGPNSYGEWVQRTFHNSVPTNDEPLGWEYQVQNDAVINYDVALEKGLVNEKHIEVIATGSGCLGTLYTNLAAGVQFRGGLLNPYFSNLGVARKSVLTRQGLRRVQCFFFVKGTGRLVGYDATLQGGMFNHSSVYLIPGSQVSRAVFQGSGGLSLSFDGIRLDLEQFLLSPEFRNGWWHKWVHVGITFAL